MNYKFAWLLTVVASVTLGSMLVCGFTTGDPDLPGKKIAEVANIVGITSEPQGWEEEYLQSLFFNKILFYTGLPCLILASLIVITSPTRSR
jgi:hypothetical protein